MAVVSVSETHNDRSGGDSYSPEKTTREDTRTFLVTTNAATDRAPTVLAHASVPKIGATHPDDSGLRCVRRRAVNQQDEGKKAWRVSCDYSSEWGQISDDPLSDPARTEWDTETFTRPVWVDRNGEAIVNSAGDPFDPPAEKDDSRLVSRTRKNVGAVPAWVYSFQDAINSEAFTLDGITVPTGTAKMVGISVGEPQERNDIPYRVLTMVMHHRGENADDVGSWGSGSGSGSSTDPGDEFEPWDLVLLDQGMRELVGGSGSGSTDLRNIKNPGDNEEVTAPVPLDGEGQALDNPTPATAVYLSFPLYAERNFNELPLT